MRLFRNLLGQIAFSEQKIDYSNAQSRNLSPVGWNLNGYSELFIASRDPSIIQKENFFFRILNAANKTGNYHWVGIRLDASNQPLNDYSCNTRGIGATVIVTANGQTQAQLVDGGSGHAGQHDLDLAFGLGSYAVGPRLCRGIIMCAGHDTPATKQPTASDGRATPTRQGHLQ